MVNIKRDFVVLTDSACDIPEEIREENGIDILNFGIALNGQAYYEREDFTPQEFYQLLRDNEQIPTTSQISVQRFLDKFREFNAAGYKRLLYVSINKSGSATHDNAVMARERFMAEDADHALDITIVDSHTYSMGYGWYVVQAAQKLDAGAEMGDIAAWLDSAFSQVEIVLGAYRLKHMKKSGHISAAAAITGDLLGIRPIISLNDGVSEVRQRIRGDQNVHPAIIAYVEDRRADNFYMVGGTDENDIATLAEECAQKWGVAPAATFFLGSAVSANTGPDAIAIVFTGAPRR